MTGLNDGWKADAPQQRPMEIGEKRIINVRDKSDVIIRQVTLTRTARPYVYDLCDAYNDGLSAEREARGIRWQVTQAGELKLGFPEEFTNHNTHAMKDRAERKRQDWLHRHRFPERYV
jgi:hypothetical protein